MPHDSIEQLVDAHTVLRRYRLRLAEAEAKILVDEIALRRSVDLVDDANHRLTALGEPTRHRLVGRRQPHATIHHKEHHIRVSDRPQALCPHAAREVTLAVDFEAPGIREREFPPIPTPVGDEPIPGNPWLIVD